VTSLLEQIESPGDLQRIPRNQLPQLAEEIRQFLVQTIAQTGGHLGANLGVVELTLALHYTFDSPQDAFVWDVSHQSYTHKLLTGRRARFATLRQLDGLAGFVKRAESDHDVFDAGHGGTSISAALGMARARVQTGTPGKVIAIIGDGALTSGMALEALNDAGHSDQDLLVILNDNAMAISPNVGALAGYLNRVRSGRRYRRAKSRFKALLRRLPGGRWAIMAIERVKAGLKQMVIPGMLFEDLGFTYLGPVDGHDMNMLLEILQQVRDLSGPVLLHILTEKGKGYSPAENHHCRLHAVPVFDLETGQPVDASCGDTFTEVFGATACRLAEADPRVVAISAAMCDGTGLADFRERFTSRFSDVGMAEEHAVTLAAGMAREGMRPIVAIYSTFMQRAYDQILHDVCLQQYPVIFALDRAGLVGEDGATHHGVFDLSYLRMMPGITLMAPATLAELDVMLDAALRQDMPCAIRYPRGRAGIESAGDLAGIRAGRAAVLRDGEDVALIAIGAMVGPALAAAEILAQQGIDAAVVNARFIKPLDIDTLLRVAGRVTQLVTIEENVIAGGFGSAVVQGLQEHGVVLPCRHLGIPDRFIEHGSRGELLRRLGLDADGIAAAVTVTLSGDPAPHPSSTPAHDRG
jgi:1-deoxy-D-xylulose-5-phosphate synthase